MPTISVAMTTFNGARFLGEQLQSIARQSRLPDELVICDDASSDESVAIIEAFAGNASFPVRVHRNSTTVGVNRNFDTAIGFTRGDLVFLCDQDDVWFPTKIERMTAALADHPECLAAICDRIVTRSDLSHEGASVIGNRLALGDDASMVVAGCATVITRKLADAAQPTPDGFTYDDWIHRVARAAGARLVMREPLQLWRRHEDNVSHPRVASVTVPQRAPSLAPRQDPLARWQRQLAENEQVAAALGRLGKADKSLALRRENAALAQRIALLRRPRWARVPGAVTLLKAGVYRPFSGWRSALRDVFR